MIRASVYGLRMAPAAKVLLLFLADIALGEELISEDSVSLCLSMTPKQTKRAVDTLISRGFVLRTTNKHGCHVLKLRNHDSL